MKSADFVGILSLTTAEYRGILAATSSGVGCSWRGLPSPPSPSVDSCYLVTAATAIFVMLLTSAPSDVSSVMCVL